MADFLGGLKSRRLPLLTVLLLSQATGLATVALAVAVRGQGAPPAGDLALGAVAGLAGLAGLAAFYRGLAVGAMAVVAPISGTGAGIPVVVGVLSGERPSALQAAGIGLAIVGVVLASREHDERADTGAAQARIATGVGLALLAAVGFGSFFVAMDAASDADFLWAILAARAASAGSLALVAAGLRQELRGAVAEAPSIALIGLLDTGANLLFAAASTKGLVSLVAVLSSLYPVVTILLARAVLGERVRRSQEAGMVLALAGVALISAG